MLTNNERQEQYVAHFAAAQQNVVDQRQACDRLVEQVSELNWRIQLINNQTLNAIDPSMRPRLAKTRAHCARVEKELMTNAQE